MARVRHPVLCRKFGARRWPSPRPTQTNQPRATTPPRRHRPAPPSSPSRALRRASGNGHPTRGRPKELRLSLPRVSTSGVLEIRNIIPRGNVEKRKAVVVAATPHRALAMVRFDHVSTHPPRLCHLILVHDSAKSARLMSTPAPRAARSIIRWILLLRSFAIPSLAHALTAFPPPSSRRPPSPPPPSWSSAT